MAGNCDICGEKLGFRKFHCQDGVVCKKCYAVVSNGFTETITKKTLAELKKTYEANAVPLDLGEDGFVVTRKIQSLLLIDEQNKKFCISGNPTVSKEYSRPEIYHYEDLIRLCDMYAKMDLVNPAAIIDANHSNSGKQFKEQIRIADGKRLSIAQKDVTISGHAIECRINAENPDKNFAPCPGTIEYLLLPAGGLGLRVDTAVYEGYEIPPYYDSMIAKVIVHGRDRKEAIAKMKRALYEFIIKGIDTNIAFQEKILNHEEYIAGDFDTTFLEEKVIDRKD